MGASLVHSSVHSFSFLEGRSSENAWLPRCLRRARLIPSALLLQSKYFSPVHPSRCLSERPLFARSFPTSHPERSFAFIALPSGDDLAADPLASHIRWASSCKMHIACSHPPPPDCQYFDLLACL
ncbi:unnamed protein product [Prorocentrum cordatum]|uniref:Uncharacterized protein n=1 Tax=Prorocentrum cordatum TaxID=2364126 RepID=A0ABN9X193_9DINO|nr:unnamed protein product [Polarella glacialis]